MGYLMIIKIKEPEPIYYSCKVFTQPLLVFKSFSKNNVIDSYSYYCHMVNCKSRNILYCTYLN